MMNKKIHTGIASGRKKDLSACLPPDNVWIRNNWEKDFSARILNPNADPSKIHGTGRSWGFEFKRCQVFNADRFNVGSRKKDLSACIAPDNVWVRNNWEKDFSSRIWNPNAVPVKIHGTGRFSMLSPVEYPDQAGFTQVQKNNVGSREQDLSACLPPDNVRVNNLQR
jgi:hypothetical protein